MKKSYRGFVWWLIIFLAACFSTPFLPIENSGTMARIVFNICTIGIAILAFIILKTGYVYWYSGLTYEQAIDAGEVRCRAYAKKHFRDFGLFALFYLPFSVITDITGVGMFIDMIVLCAGLFYIAIHSMKYKL